jgi:hypothetical protein
VTREERNVGLTHSHLPQQKKEIKFLKWRLDNEIERWQERYRHK